MTRRFSESELIDLVRRIFVRHGMSPENASLIARNCVGAERDGAGGHGLFRVPGYVATLKSGWVDGSIRPLIAGSSAGVVRIDARNGFAQPALELARTPAVEKARAGGTCLIAIRDSHHFAALWPDVETFARDGLVALAFVNVMSRMVPWGGRKPVYGTNPMALAVPREGEEPLVFDQASSTTAYGEVVRAAEQGRAVASGTGVDRLGFPTVDAAQIVAGGALLPFGGYKGSSIAMMVEVLAAALTGGNFSFEVDASGHAGAQTSRTGELVILIDPRHTGGEAFTRRMETLIARLHDSGQSRLPGDERYRRRREAARDGISLDERVIEQLHAYL